ncbi:hypothetical protein PHYC_00411 [Phycisphaerales bacterium]|nr:hypothetical protein PHYC_00411 [Phycisphaerales bacterium]
MDGPTASEYDALTDLFLSDPALAPAGRVSLRIATDEHAAKPLESERTALEPTIEGLILGHLPVLGSAWVTQYAKFIAERDRSAVAILRLQGGQAWIDLVMPRGADRRMHSRIGSGTGVSNAELSTVISEVAGETAHWLVRVDETGEPDLVRTAGLSALAMLTGADDPAVLASYRTIKNLCEGLGEDVPTFRIAVMGAEDEKAAAAEAKLSKAAAVFLSKGIETGIRVGKIGACATVAMHRAETSLTLPALLGMVRGAYSRSAAEPAQEAPVEPGATPEQPVKGGVAGAGPASTMDSAVAGQLGLAMLATACPYVASVRLACAPDGSLHLIALADPTPESAVRDLLGAAAWADHHSVLLESVHPNHLKGIEKAGPTLHMLTDDPKSCRNLLDTGVRVHFAMRVDGRWVVKDLN